MNIEVPQGCRERFKFIDDHVDELLQQWTNGNRDHVFNTLMEMPKSVAIAVAAGIAERYARSPGDNGLTVGSGFRERAR